MEQMAGSQELRPKYVTQDEASAVVELWGELQQTRTNPHLVTVADLSETLQISETEAEKLLMEVRARHRPIAQPMPIEDADYAGVLKTVGAITLLGTVSLGLLYLFQYIVWHKDNMYIDGGKTTIAWLALLWCTGWGWYFRRPIARFVFRFLRGRE